ncbi:MAG: gluconokinase [Armatimonadota bacterium]|nr:gluconokinase [Armatimonadota bacterium]MDW8105795.1 gluconokinase [Armatimonadota bacterium]
MTGEPLILAVDVGTTNLKAGVVDRRGQVWQVAQRELPLLRDETGKAEHDPHLLWRLFCEVARQAASGCRQQVQAVVLSAYQLSLLAVDEHGEPLTGVITLLDTRPQQTYPQLLERMDARQLYRRTGCPPLFHYPLSKIFWLQSVSPDLFARARRFVGAKDYLLYRLTGEWATEASLGTATQLMNLHTLEWDEMALGISGVEREQLPQRVASEEVWTTLPSSVCAELGVGEGCRLVPGVYDGGAVAIGLGALLEGTGAVNLGTTAMLRVAMAQPVLDADPAMRLQTCYLVGGRWFPGGAINNAGVTLRWLRDNLLHLDYEAMNREAEGVADSAGLFFLPFLSGERHPQVGNTASGVFFGLRGYHTRGHLVRATMEGVCFALRLVYDALRENGVQPGEIRIGGGGARSPLWMQTMANVLGVPLQVSEVTEAGLVGSAILAWRALGVYPDGQTATREMVRAGRQYLPRGEAVADYARRYRFFRQLMQTLAGAFAEHAQY